MNVNLKKIELTGFRGALSPVNLTFPENGQGSIFLYGEGGTGKTTFSEAIEWFYKDKVETLEKEFCGKDCYFNIRLNQTLNAFVRIDYTETSIDSIKTLHRRGNNRYSNTSADFKDYIARSLNENFVLRYYDLKDFVDEKTKAQKLDHFAKLIGFEQVTSTRTVLMQAFNALKDSQEASRMAGQLDEAKRFLSETIGGEVITEDGLLSYVKAHIGSILPDHTMATLDDIPTTVKKLDALADISEISKRKNNLEALKEQLDKSKNIWGAFLPPVSSWLDKYRDYLRDAEIIQKESLLKLYSIGKQILSGAEWTEKDRCPLCGSSIEGQLLIEHLSEEISRIESTLGKKKTLTTEFETISLNITKAIGKLRTDSETLSENKNKEPLIDQNKDTLLSALSLLIAASEELHKDIDNSFKSLHDVSFDLSKHVVCADELKRLYGEFRAVLLSGIASLVVRPEIQKYRDAARLLEKLHEHFKRTQELSFKVEQLHRQVDSLKAIQEAFEEKEKEIFKQIIAVLSKDIDTYYSLLNPGENVDNISLFPTEDKGAGRGLEIAYQFHGSEQYPARKYLSESHRSSLGISIFLASAKHFNKVNKFLILDDIYTSLDVNHRERLVQLFTHPTLSDMQFLITTHDLVWFKTVQRTLQASPNWKFFEIRKWRIDAGIEIAEAPESIRKRITGYLDSGDIHAACRSIRGYYEETLKRIGKKLEIRVPYRDSASWSADEFYSGIGERIRGSAVSTDSRYTAGSPIGFLSNLTSHENNVAVSSGTVQSIVELVDNFRQAFVCADCQKPIWHAKKQSGGFQCQCGTLHCG